MKKAENAALAAPEPGEKEHGPASRAGRFLLRASWEVVSTVVPALLIALVVNTYVAHAITVDGPSMQPNLYYDQQVMIEKVTYRLIHGPRRGDVVVFALPGEETPLIKRVVALPGETVEVRGGQVYIDGEPLEETWVIQLGGPDYPSTSVPPLHVFVLGDNRPNSHDSRAFGPVRIDRIAGRALFVYWPPDQAGVLASW